MSTAGDDLFISSVSIVPGVRCGMYLLPAFLRRLMREFVLVRACVPFTIGDMGVLLSIRGYLFSVGCSRRSMKIPRAYVGGRMSYVDIYI